MVGLSGFEPLTSPLSGVRSNQLSYRPMRRKFTGIPGYVKKSRLSAVCTWSASFGRGRPVTRRRVGVT